VIPIRWQGFNRYDRFPWMQQRFKIIQGNENYEPKQDGGFPAKLIAQKTMVWTCQGDPLLIPPFIQCLNYVVSGKYETIPNYVLNKKEMNQEEFLKHFTNIPTSYIIEPLKMQELCVLYEVVVDRYFDRPIERGRRLEYRDSWGMDPTLNQAPKIVGFLSILKHNGGDSDYYAVLLPDLKNFLPLVLKYHYCETCGHWRTNENWLTHIKKCKKCSCGTTYTKGDGSHDFCTSQHKYKKAERRKAEQIRIYAKDPPEKKGPNYGYQYFADFETFVEPNQRDYQVYAAAYINGKIEENGQYRFSRPFSYYGESSLDKFMKNVLQYCKGIMWFFNGSRFDAFFILKWLLKNKIKIEQGSVLIKGNNLLSIKFKTKRGWLQLKDLSKFLSGTLKNCCESFELGDQSKTDFDHDKMVSWEAVWQNRIECEEYLKMDVISLRALTVKFFNTMFDLYHIDPSKYMTITQIAYAAWTSDLDPQIADNLFKTPIEDEEKMREMYKGGRVLCGRKQWKSNCWKEVKEKKMDYIDPTIKGDDVFDCDLFKMNGHCVSQELYNSIWDYLMYADVNSLYPSVQISTNWPKPNVDPEGEDEIPEEWFAKYPYGKYVHKEYEEQGEDEIRLMQELNNLDNSQRVKWSKMGACVDISCPYDLTVAFLMTKDKKTGSVEQSLYKKEKIWFTGPELWEACILGYKITRIYETFEWPYQACMFKEFVEKTYDIKKNAQEGSKRAAAKQLLNGLTGKFGQKNVPQNIVIIDSSQEEIDKDITGITQIVDEYGELLGYYGYEEREFYHSPFPIEQSCWILANARIYMSKLLRKMKIERAFGEDEYGPKYDQSPFYSDTDSLILHRESWDRLEDEMKGDKELGQLKLEIDGKIISFICLANKTYSITYIDRKTLRILSITKTKGIPHKGTDPKSGAYNTFDLYKHEDKEDTRARMHSNFLDLRRNHKIPSFVFAPESNNITSRAYIFRDATTDDILHVCYKIPPTFLPKILKRKWKMECVFGGMTRSLKPGGLEYIFIAPETKSRTLCLTDYWSQQKRCHLEEELQVDKYATAYPLGHYRLEEEIEDRQFGLFFD
jgi:hypothetical protein